VDAVNTRIRAVGGDSMTVRFTEGIVTINRESATRAGLKPDSILDALAKDMRRLPGVGRVDWVKDLARTDTTRDDVARRWLHMLPADLPADLVMSLAPYAYFASVDMATHGTPNDYDAHVPVIFYGPPFVPGKYKQRALVADMAPTLAAVVDVTPAEAVDGKARIEVIRRPSP
jgi:hypothetical protein